MRHRRRPVSAVDVIAAMAVSLMGKILAKDCHPGQGKAVFWPTESRGFVSDSAACASTKNTGY